MTVGVKPLQSNYAGADDLRVYRRDRQAKCIGSRSAYAATVASTQARSPQTVQFPWKRVLGITALSLSVVVLLGMAAAYGSLRHALATTLPVVTPIDPYSVFVDSTPVTVTIAAGGEHVDWRTTADDVRGSVTLWRRMHLENWNAVSEPLREDALDNMFKRYRVVLMSPRAWDTMDAYDWS